MNQAEPRAPQVAFVSSTRDRGYIYTLVRALRGRGLEVWWDGDGLEPGEPWEEKTWATLRATPITCVLVSNASLASREFQRAIDVVLHAGRRLVPIHIEELERSWTLPKEVVERERIPFLRPEDLEPAVDALERLVRVRTESPVAEAARQHATEATPPSPPLPPTPPSPTTITLRFGDETTPETWTVGADLRRTIEEAARLRGQGSIEAQFPVSFSTLLTAIFTTGTTWSQWAFGIAKVSGFDTTKLRPLPAREIPVAPSDRTTTSAARILRSAKGFAGRANTTPNVQHLLAAYIYEPAGHEKDLDAYGFDRVIWANALIEEVGKRSPADVPVLTALRDAAFPVTPPPPISPVDAPDAASSGESSEPGTPQAWAEADPELMEAFAWAATLAPAASEVGIRELLAGLLRSLDPQSPFWGSLASAMPNVVVAGDDPPWRLVWPSLGVPDPPGRPPTLSALPVRRREVDAVLASATRIQERMAGSNTAPAACVFIALFEPPGAGRPAAIDPLLHQLGLEADVFLRRAQDNSAGQPAAVLHEIRGLRGAFNPWGRPHVDNDRVDGPISPDRDLLDARRPALRFAKLLAACDIHPPIALGLFGNWGSGKTFFMGLMRDRIADLAKNGGDDFVRRVVQIEFNAWHYHDSNLWASLAIRIFEGLARELAGHQESDIERTRKALHQKLRSSEARRQEAETRRAQALTRRASLAEALDARRAKRAELEKQSVLRRLEAGWQVMTEGEVFSRFRAALVQLGNQFGLESAMASAEDLRRLRRDIEETSGRAFGLFSAIGHRFHGLGRSAQTVGLLVLVAASVLALGRGFDKVAELLRVTLPQFSSTVLEVSALVSTFAAWSGRRVAQLRGAIDHIAKVETALAAAERTVEPIELKQLLDEIAALDKAIHQAGEELSASEREIAEATAEIDRINRGGLVYDFLQERQTSASYVGQLGLISTIRQDFDRLGALLQDFEKEGIDPIERIVLYIDDLDRCHPDKVVEVLQAVHLLLAFNLFNVVVGVDARWLERSLRRQYVGQDAAANAGDPFSPQNYLEKIFQIPYALTRIDQTGFAQLVGGLIDTRSDVERRKREKERQEAEKAGVAKATAEAAAQAAQAARTSTTAGDAVPTTVATETTPGGATTGPHETTHVGDAIGADTQDAHAAVSTGGITSAVASAASALYFEDHEETFIQLLYEFIDSPRLAKRFINIYRLLRVRADDEGESARFAASSTSEEYRAALVLLAVQVGHPDAAAANAAALARHGKAHTWPELLTELAEGRFANPPVKPNTRIDIQLVANKLARVGERVPQDIEAYRRWAPRVASYSFGWHGGNGDGAAAQAPSVASTTPSTPKSQTT